MEGFTTMQVGGFTVVEFYDTSLMDPVRLQDLAPRLYRLIDEEDHRWMVLDFARVEYISSQFIGILLGIQKKLAALPKSQLTLCGINARLQELLRLTKLDKVFTVAPTQREAVQTRHA